MKRRLLRLLAAGCALALLALPLWAQEDTDNPTENANEITIPEGTEFKLQLHSSVSSKTSHPGDRIITTLLDPVAVEDQDILPKGVRIDGHIGEVKEAAHRGRGGTLSLVFDTIELPSGQKVAILGSLTEVFSSEGGNDPNVGAEGDLKGGGPSRKKQVAIVAATTAVGATGGVYTAIAGAGVGIALAVLLPHGKQAALTTGSLIGMRLDRDVTYSVASNTPAPAPASAPAPTSTPTSTATPTASTPNPSNASAAKQ